mgnify:CR=1 FL=1
MKEKLDLCQATAFYSFQPKPESELDKSLSLDHDDNLDHTAAGIGICVNNSFLDKFTSFKWVPLLPGTLARLELLGPSGTLHIYCFYGNAHTCSKRKEQIKQQVQKQEQEQKSL